MKSKSHNKLRFWRSVFRRVMAHYDEVKAVYVATPALNYERALDNGGIGGTGFRVGVVQPTLPDLLADIELAAKRALTELEHLFFTEIYLNKNEGYKRMLLMEWGDEDYTTFKHTVQEKVGKMLVSRKIYPVTRYMKARDLR